MLIELKPCRLVREIRMSGPPSALDNLRLLNDWENNGV